MTASNVESSIVQPKGLQDANSEVDNVTIAENNIGDIESGTSFLDFLGSLFDYEDQYITWLLVIISIIVPVVIAFIQSSANKKVNENLKVNEWTREFKEKLSNLEDDSLMFWTSAADNGVTDRAPLKLQMFARDVKELTSIANDIANTVGGIEYQNDLFRRLRKSVTDDTDLDRRPLKTTEYRINDICEVCNELREKYKRK